MASWLPALVALTGVAAVIVAVVWLKIHPFVALLTASIGVGLASGMAPQAIISAITEGMGDTLGFVAVVVGLGSMFGMMLEESGGAERLAERMVACFGESRTGLALGLVGFLVCIPVFLDVALVMLMPLAIAASRRTGRSITSYALPMLSGMAVSHAFVPPTPGPTAVAQLLAADLGWVIALGIATGLPTLLVTAIIATTVLARQAAGRMPPAPITRTDAADTRTVYREPSVAMVLALLLLPLVLIVGDTVVRTIGDEGSGAVEWLSLVGHPFTALLIATIASFYFLGIRLGMSATTVQRVAERGLEPAGLILLVTGAGGVFKQVLIDSGTGSAVASSLAAASLPTLVVAWLVAAAIRVLQGSATVAMITAAGLVAPLIPANGPAWFPALVTLAIAAGSSIASHVNDSGFWLVGRFLGLTVGETLRTWTIAETIVAVAGLAFVLIAAAILASVSG